MRDWLSLTLVLSLAACSSMTSGDGGGAIDGSVAGGGGGARGGGAGGGVGGGGGEALDAGPPEPTLVSSILFRDAFDQYPDVIALRAAYPEIREVGGHISLARDGGEGALALDYEGDGGCSATDVHVGKIVSGNVPTVLVTWRTRVPSGFHGCGDAGVEDFALTRGPSRTTFERGATGWVVKVGEQRFEQHARLDTHAPSALAPDAWHRVTVFFTRESTPDAGDGVVQVWVDGASVIDLTGPTGTAPFSLATWPGALGNDAVQSRLVDDLAIATP